MGRAEGEVIRGDKVVGYFVYHATVDQPCSRIFETEAELDDTWQMGKRLDAECDCGGAEPVLLWTAYGSSFYWPATACLECGAIVSGFDPYEHDGPTPGHPLRPAGR